MKLFTYRAAAVGGALCFVATGVNATIGFIYHSPLNFGSAAMTACVGIFSVYSGVHAWWTEGYVVASNRFSEQQAAMRRRANG